MKTYNKRLYRSEDNKIMFGIMGGFGEYFDIDPTILRAIYIVVSVFTAIFPGIIAYILMAMVVPKHPDVIKAEMRQAEEESKKQEPVQNTTPKDSDKESEHKEDNKQ